MDQSISLTPYNLVTEPVNDASFFAQTFMYKPPQGQLHRKRGELFALLSVTNLEAEIDKSQLAKQVFDHLQQEYFSEETGSAFEALENAANNAVQHGQKLVENPATQINLVATAIWGKSFHFYRTPNSYLGQMQNGELLGLDQHQLGTESFSHNNKIILATPLFAERIFKPLVQELTEPLVLDQELPKLRERLLSLDEEKPAAAVIINVAVAEVPSEEEIIEIEIAENHHKNQKRRLPNFTLPNLSSLPSVFENLSSALHRPSSNDSKPEIYLKPRFPESKKGRLVVALLLMGLLGSSALATHKINQRNEKRQQAQEIIQNSTERIEKARELAALNPAQAQRELAEVSDQLGNVLGTTDKVDKKAQELQSKLTDVTQELYATQTVTARAVESADELDAQNLTVNTTEGVVSRSSEVYLTRVDEWQTPVAVEEYFDNLYVLDRGANQIHKYIGIPSGYSNRRDYFKHPVNLNGAVNLAIDGSIYVLYGDGRVLKFTAGKREEFSMDNFHPPLDGVKLIETTADSEHLYVTKDNRVMIFDKDGQYQRQLRVENLEKIKALSLSPDKTKLYLLEDQKWYEVSY